MSWVWAPTLTKGSRLNCLISLQVAILLPLSYSPVMADTMKTLNGILSFLSRG